VVLQARAAPQRRKEGERFFGAALEQVDADKRRKHAAYGGKGTIASHPSAGSAQSPGRREKRVTQPRPKINKRNDSKRDSEFPVLITKFPNHGGGKKRPARPRGVEQNRLVKKSSESRRNLRD